MFLVNELVSCKNEEEKSSQRKDYKLRCLPLFLSFLFFNKIN
jgi:hypothetical protein